VLCVRYPSPTSSSSLRQWENEQYTAKNSTASSISIRSTSPIDLSRHLIASVSSLKRAPPHTSHNTLTSGRKLISIVRTPWPSHASQRPPLVLNEKRLAP